jgi:hypothetical protein
MQQMKKLGMIAAFGAVLAWVNISSATIIGEDCGWPSGLQNVTWAWDNTNYIMSIGATQTSSPGSVAGWFTTDAGGDPTITMDNTINNDTGYAWTSYDVNVYMNQVFTLTSPVVNYPTTTEPGWTGTITVSPAVWNGTQYEASAVFTGGAPLQVGDVIDFGYQASFTGSVNFTQQLVPVPEEVPEPGTLLLALAGLVGLVAVRRLRTR